jgi:hypothetical protein
MVLYRNIRRVNKMAKIEKVLDYLVPFLFGFLISYIVAHFVIKYW